jgi:hypothetical protein
MTPENFKTVLYRQDHSSRVADTSAVPGGQEPIPTRDVAVAKLAKVFATIAEQCRLKGQAPPAGCTEFINA